MRVVWGLWGCLSLLTAQSLAQEPNKAALSPARADDPSLPKPVPEFLRNLDVSGKLRLPALSLAESAPKRRGRLTSIGVRRAIHRIDEANVYKFGAPGGREIWAIEITSPGATYLRLHFRDFDAQEAEVFVFAPDATRHSGPYTGRGIFNDGEFWSATVEGPKATVACIFPAGVQPKSLPFTIDAVSHQWASLPQSSEPAAAASCNLDVACYPAYKDYANAVAAYTFIDDTNGASYSCSGAMINTRNVSFKPYFLTAHHCIGSNSEAKSIQAFFFYQASVCNGAPPSLGSLPTVQGGTYLAGAPIIQGDYSLVQLSSAPSGVYYLGWGFNLPFGTSATGIHHPQSSYKRISFGSRSPDVNLDVDGEFGPANLYYQVGWSSGLTEPGSSGSPLLGANGEIYGTLTGGPVIPAGKSVCEIAHFGSYGRFDNTYAAIKSYLEDQPTGNLTAKPASATFQVTDGAVSPVKAVISVSVQSTAPVNLTARSNQPWITATVSPTASSASSATLNIGIDPLKLTSIGTLQGTVTVSSPSNSVDIGVVTSVSVSRSNVSLSVTPNPVVQQASDSDGNAWFFTFRATESAPVDTTLTGLKIDGVDYSSQILNYFGTTVLARNSALTTAMRSKDLKTPVSRTFELAGVDAITNRPWQATVVVPFIGTTSPKPQVTAIVNAASYAAGPVAPGENVVLFGSLIGPASLTANAPANNAFSTSVGDTRVLLDGIAAPILYASGTQTAVMIPYSIYGRATTNLVVESGGVQSSPLAVSVAASAPAIYTMNQTGSGPAAILNQDGITGNTPHTPELRGNTVTVYLTGEGQTDPPGADGAIVPPVLSALKRPLLPVTAAVGGIAAQVTYAGSAPGLVSGLMQVNVVIPTDAPIGGAVPIVVTVGSASTQAGVTLAIR